MNLKTKKDTYVISLGGSVFAPSEPKKKIDIEYLKKFEVFIREKISAGKRFFIVVGGGYTAREYRDAAAQAVNGQGVLDSDLDWLGIHSSRLNAHLFRTIFSDIAYKKILDDFDKIDKRAAKYPLVFGAGWKPGWSTDYDAVLIAHDYGVSQVINLSNIKYVFDKDPDKHQDAKPIKRIKWHDFFDLVGDEWSPGLNMPFDPIASRLAAKLGIKVTVCNGHDLKNLDKILSGKDFTGTSIE